jgi:lysophospholipase L1-like esterase
MVIAAAVLFILILGFMAFVGAAGYYGPFKGLSVLRIQLMYHGRPEGETVFYGASNFTLWGKMEEDMKPLAVQNHGFGGSTDRDMMEQADKLLYPYRPNIVVFQSGSNDFITGLTAADICANKDRMYTAFRERLPDATFIVMSMLPLPGRGEHWPGSAEVNQYLSEYCRSHGNMVFVDATGSMMTPDGGFRPELYRSDGVHLNRDGQLVWGGLIKKAIEGAGGDA